MCFLTYSIFAKKSVYCALAALKSLGDPVVSYSVCWFWEKVNRIMVVNENNVDLRTCLCHLILQVEGSVVHIMKALASHPCAAQSLIEDDSLQLLFQMVVNGSLAVFMQYRDGLVPLHSIQLHRHAMQASLGLTLFPLCLTDHIYLPV